MLSYIALRFSSRVNKASRPEVGNPFLRSGSRTFPNARSPFQSCTSFHSIDPPTTPIDCSSAYIARPEHKHKKAPEQSRKLSASTSRRRNCCTPSLIALCQQRTAAQSVESPSRLHSTGHSNRPADSRAQRRLSAINNLIFDGIHSKEKDSISILSPP